MYVTCCARELQDAQSCTMVSVSDQDNYLKLYNAYYVCCVIGIIVIDRIGILHSAHDIITQYHVKYVILYHEYVFIKAHN